jgi:antitoxin FitA
MATLTIKNLPDSLYQRLKARAATHRRSINSEAMLCLELALKQPPVDEELLLGDLRVLREEAGVYLADEALRQAIEDGRP